MRVRSIVLALGLAAVGCASKAPPPAAPALTPAQRRAIELDGLAAYERKEWASCARLLEQAAAHYDAACCYAQAGDRDRAFAMLDKAIAVDGFADHSHLSVDPDLEPLRADPRWGAIDKAVAARAAERRARLNAEMLQLFDEDQADRSKDDDKTDWSMVAQRDQDRRKRADEILAAGGAKVADDYYHAAMLFQHGGTAASSQRAHELAKKAVELDPAHKQAKWLAAAAEDRKLMLEKKPQKWGTQYTMQGDRWVLWEVDPSITDEQRAQWNVPPLAFSRARVERLNQSAR